MAVEAHAAHSAGYLITGPVQVIIISPTAREVAATGLAIFRTFEDFVDHLYTGPTTGTKSAALLATALTKGIGDTNNNNFVMMTPYNN